MTSLSRVRAFFREARRRRIYTSAGAYIAVSAVVIELGSNILVTVLPKLTWAPKLLTIGLMLGFPVVLVLAWIFDIGPEGVHRTNAIGQGAAPPVAPAQSSGWSGAFTTSKTETRPRQIELVEQAPEPERVKHASLAFVRHELRTPINAIIGYSEMLLEDALDEGDDVASADLERILHCGRDILTLVDRILDAERVSTEAQRDVESYAEQIRADLRDPLSAVTGYTEMLIEISREEGREARARDLDRVLSASHKLLDLSNDIAALATRAPNASAAELAKGATLAEGVLSKIRAVATHDAGPDREGALLVVDDSAMNRDLLAKQLARKGYVVATAESGRGALDLLNEQTFDLVLLDVLMPEMDGVEVLRRMKGDAVLCDVPVIMISALDEIDSVVRCLEIGAADFVSKPVHPTLLDARIQATLTAHHARSAPRIMDGAGARLLTGTFPDYVVQRVANGETRLLDAVPNAAAYFIDVEHAVAAADPRERAARVETIIATAYTVAAKHNAEILLHGIGLLMAAGFPQPREDAADVLARAALAFTREAEAHGLRCRSGLHVGSLYAALVGNDKLAYTVWGDAVDLARRMALGAERGQIVVSAACHGLLKDRFALRNQGVIEVAGRGQMKAFLLETQAVSV